MKRTFLMNLTFFLTTLLIINGIYAAPVGDIIVNWWVITKDFVVGLFVVIPDTPITGLFSFISWIGLWMIVYGFLKMLRIFGRRTKWLNVGLSLIIALTSLLMRIPQYITSFMFGIMGMASAIIFGLMFVVGIWLFFKRRKAEWGSQASVAAGYDEVVKGLRYELASKRETMMELTEKLAKTNRADRRADIEKQLTKVKEDVRSLEDRLEEMKHTVRSA